MHVLSCNDYTFPFLFLLLELSCYLLRNKEMDWNRRHRKTRKQGTYHLEPNVGRHYLILFILFCTMFHVICFQPFAKKESGIKDGVCLQLGTTYHVNELNETKSKLNFDSLVHYFNWSYEFVVVTKQVTNQSLFVLRTDNNLSGNNVFGEIGAKRI